MVEHEAVLHAGSFTGDRAMNLPLATLESCDRRIANRLKLRCRARIRVGKRHYAGYVEDISTCGARIRTLSPIVGTGPVCVVVPDLPPLRGHISWIEPQTGGVCFNISLSPSTLKRWANSRLGGSILAAAV